MIVEVLLLLFVIFSIILGAIAVFFFIRLSLRIEIVAKHLDITLTELDRVLPVFIQQSGKTMESLELTSNHTRKLLGKVEGPLEKINSISAGFDSFVSPEMFQGIIGVIKGLGFFRKLFGKGGETEGQ